MNPATGSLVAKSSQLPQQPLTSHPSVEEQLNKGSVSHPFMQMIFTVHSLGFVDFDYREDSVVISKGNLITRYFTPRFPDDVLCSDSLHLPAVGQAS
jgi:hypothetical protein